MRKLVGISQKIKRAWLDAVLDRLAKTTDEAELRTFLDKYLKEELPGTESRAKTCESGVESRLGVSPFGIGLWRCCPKVRAKSASGCIGA
jgi:hypothetical protein